MKKALLSILAVAMVAMFASCASVDVRGNLLTKVKLPVTVGSAKAKTSKIGVSTCVTYLGMIAQGDASIAAACANGGITEIAYVDWEADSLLGLIGNYKCIVYGN